MSAIEDRERAVLVDLSRAVSSADAVRQLEETLNETTMILGPGALIEINTGDLLLTPGVLSKIHQVTRRYNVSIATLYSDVPQTQQSALDEGLFVRRMPPARKQIDLPARRPTAPQKGLQNLDLPFESNKPDYTSKSPSVLSRLSITLDDGTVEEVKRLDGAPMETVFYKQTLRSGQVLEATGNIVVIGDAHSGSEILADGDILVWGVLGGVAHAGRNGYTAAEIRAIRIEAVQLRIAHAIARRPDRLFKAEARRRGPEVAKIKHGEIQIYEDILER